MKLVAALVVSQCDDLKLTSKVLESLENQTDKEFSTIVLLNGFSEVPSLITQKIRSLDISVIKNEKIMQFWEALNLILSNCHKDDIFIRVDADDICLPMRMEYTKQVFINSENNKKIIYGDAIEVSRGGNKAKRDQVDVNKHFQNSKLSNPIVHSTVAFRVGDILENGGYPSFRRAQDLALWLRLFKAKFDFIRIPFPLVEFQLPTNPRVSRGLRYFISEIQIYKFAYKIGYADLMSVIIALSNKAFIRLLFSILPGSLTTRLINDIIKHRHNKL